MSRTRVLLSVLVVLLVFVSVPAVAAELFFSEYIEGSSNNKALEIYNGTGAAINLATAGYNVQMYFNGSASAGLTINLTGTVANGDVFVLAQSAADAAILAQADQTNGAGWFNGDDAVVLRKGTTIIDAIGQIGFDPGTEWGSGLPSTADNTLRRKQTITAGDTDGTNVFDPSVEWDGFATNTFGGLGAHGTVDPTPTPTPTATPTPTPVPTPEIFEIQGSGAASSFVGQIVKTLQNIVTAVGSEGFFIQTPDHRADADPSTSNGIYVFTSSTPAVAVGEMVDVQGTVAEFFNLTELTNPTVTILFGGAPLPAPVIFNESTPSPIGSDTQLERYEGMLVSFENGTATAPTDRFGDVKVVARSTRAYREPGLDWDGNPEIFEIDPDKLGLPPAEVPAGSRIDRAAGPLSFAFGDYQIWPTDFQFTPASLPVPARARVDGEFTVATQNVLHLYDTINDPGSDDVLTVQEYSAKLDKVALQIIEVLRTPDILVLQEVEKLAVLEDLAARVQSLSGAVYSAHLLEGNDIGGIDVGVLVLPTISVQSIDQFGKTDTWTFNGATELLNDRPPLVVRASYVGNGAAFPITVIGVHQRSLNDIEAPRTQAKRYEQSIRLAAYIDSLLEAEPSTRLVVTGDFNAFEFSDGYVEVIGILTGICDAIAEPYSCDPAVDTDLSAQILTLPASDRYSYIFEGSAQALDHTLTSPALGTFLRGFVYVRGNADAPERLQNEPTTFLRSSDHDGAVLFVMSDADGDGTPDDRDDCPASDSYATVILDGCDSSVPDLELEPGCFLSDRLAGFRAGAKNHGKFVADAARFLEGLVAEGLLSEAQKDAVVSCAARAE